MQNHNRLITIFMLLLMITWFAPMVINDNIASAYLSYSFNYLGAIDIPGDASWDVTTDGNFTYAVYDDGGLYIINSTTLSILTAIDNGSHYVGVDTYKQGNSVYIAVACQIEGLRMYNFTYINSTSYTLVLCDTINASLENTMPYINSTGTVFCGAGNDGINAYSFDYGGTDNFTWINNRNDGTSITGGVIDVTSDRGYIYACCEDLGLRVYTFNGATFNLITTKDDSTADYISLYVDKNNYIYTTCGNSASPPGYKDEVCVYTFYGSTLTLKYKMTLTTTSSTQTHITGNDTYIFLTHSSNGISAYSLYNGVSMTLLTTDKHGSSGYYNVAVDANFIYATVQDFGLYIYTFSTTSITSISIFTKPATGISYTYATLNGIVPYYFGDNVTDYGFELGKTTAYSYGKLNSTYTSIAFTNGTNIHHNIHGLAGTYYDGTYIYVATHNSTSGLIEAYRWDGYSFSLVANGSIYPGNGQGTSVYGDGTYIYVVVTTGLATMRIEAFSFNGATFTFRANLSISTYFHHPTGMNFYETSVYCDGTYIYTHNASGLVALTFNGTTFKMVGNIASSLSDRAWSFAGDGTYLYALGYLLSAYSFNGTSFTLLDTIDLDNTNHSYCGVATDGTYVYTTDYESVKIAYLFNGTNFTALAYDTWGGLFMTTDANNIFSSYSDYIYMESFDGVAFTHYTSWHKLGYDQFHPLLVNHTCFTSSVDRNLNAFTFYTSLNITGLTPGTLYHFRAYATNNNGIAYGIDRTFQTLSYTGVYLDLNINVYNESNGTEGIPFNILIKNLNGSQVYSLLNQHNTLHLNTTSISGNQNVLIKVWSLGYRERIIIVPVTTSFKANYTFYLPKEVMPPGDDPGGGSGYSPSSDIISLIYNVRIVETIRTEYAEFDRPISGAWVNVRRYINSTGDFERMSTLTTDTNGYCNFYFIPSVLYVFDISATYFDNNTADWNPVPPSPYQQTEVKIFRMTRHSQAITPANYTYIMKNLTYSLEPTGTRQEGAITFYYNITSYDNKLQWYRMQVSYYNVTTHTWSVLYSHNHSDAGGGSISYTTPNVTGEYKIDVWFKKNGFNEYKIYQTGSLHYTIIYINSWIRAIPSYVYFLVLIVIMIIVMGYCFATLGTGFLTGYIGLGIMAFGILLKPDLVVNNFGGATIWAITFIIYTMGLFLWSRL